MVSQSDVCESTANSVLPFFNRGEDGLSFTNGTLRLGKLSLFSTAIWMLLAHLYRWVHVTSASHDSLMILQHDAGWEISLGRFLQPVYTAVRGEVVAPLLIGVISIIFLALTVVFVCRILDLRSTLSIVLLSGFLSTNATIALHNATYIFSLDMCMLTCLLGALSVYWCIRYRFGFLLGILCTVSILAIAPSYIAFSVTLALLYFVRVSLRGHELPGVLITGIKYLILLMAGAVLYIVVFPLVQDATGYHSSSYLGFSSMGDFTGVSIPNLLLETYLMPFAYMARPETHATNVVSIVNGAILLLTIVGYIRFCICEKASKVRIVLPLVFIALLPLGANCVCFVSKGTMHGVMIFSYYLLYALPLMVLEFNLRLPSSPRELHSKEGTKTRRKRASTVLAKCISMILVAIIFSSNIIYANQIYVKKDLEATATLSIMTRIMGRVESIEGYDPGVTPVAFVGCLENSEAYSQSLKDFPPDSEGSQLKGTGLTEGAYSVTYPSTYRMYLGTVLNEPINLIDDAESAEIAKKPSVEAMPAFPAIASCQMVDGVVVVKLSDE
ncbi:glucosyltransferase domain-containing protein [Raoultibacter timonensis]|uniref:glucosyltransferase domain-containing protein n=1 Tax=Raoultibacter timonensis TaxID=1907662 RepID=UPI0015E192D8|nr:glucosyltransferase domain-containing protein [Raoultibacter timonensis]